MQDEAGRCDTASVTVIAELTDPSVADCAHLTDLQENYTGLRDMIARHPSRSDFFLGTAEFDGVWFGWPLCHQPIPCDPCGETTTWNERHWDNCPTGHNFSGQDCVRTCDYCESDPRLVVPPYGTLPLKNQAITSYLAHDFNLQMTTNCLLHHGTARKAFYEEPEGEEPPFDVDYCYTLADANYAAPTQAMGMKSYVLGPIYWLAAWIPYGLAMGRLSPETTKEALEAHLLDLIDHYTQEQGYRFDYYSICLEMLRERDDTTALNNLGDLIKWDREFFLSPAGRDTEIDRRLWWPWYILSEPNQTGSSPYTWGDATDTANAANCLLDLYRIAADNAPESKLVYDEYGIEFRYAANSTPQNLVDHRKYQRLMKLIDEFQSAETPLDAIGIQMHIPAWSCLTYDEGLRLNPKQLQSLRDSVRGIGDKGIKAIISSMDLRMGVPGDIAGKMDNIDVHLGANREEWDELSVNDRSEWQGKVYEAVLNAALAVPALDGIVFWNSSDETSWYNSRAAGDWPYAPSLPSEDACSAALFGDNPATTGEREMYYPKPAYWGMRNAMTNYFGNAFVVRDPAGDEVVRFVENGNVLLMRPGAHVTESVTSFCGGKRGLTNR